MKKSKFKNKRKKIKEKNIDRDLILYKRFLEKNYYRVKKFNELINILPKENEQIRIITQQSFNSFSILLYLLENIKDIIECYITTFSIDQQTAVAICDLVESNKIKDITLIITSLLKYDRSERREMLINCAKNNKNFKFIETYNHTKIIGVKNKENKYFLIEGSGNLSANARIEQYLFEQSKESYLFHKKWIDDINNFAQKKDTKIF